MNMTNRFNGMTVSGRSVSGISKFKRKGELAAFTKEKMWKCQKMTIE